MIFDYNENYGYDVKIDNIGVGTFDVIARCNNNNDLYNVGIDLSFITTERYTARWVGSEVEYTGVADDILADNEEGINFVDVTNGIYTFNNRHGIENGFIIRFKGKLSINKLINFDSGDVDATYYSEYGVAIDDNGKFLSNKLTLTNLVSNGDLLIDSDSDGVPDGFTYGNATDISLTNGIAKFTATAQYGRMQGPTAIFNTSDTYYSFARVKTLGKKVALGGGNYFAGLGQWENGSHIFKAHPNISNICQINDFSTDDFKEIEVDYIGAINLTEIFGAGNEPSKEIMDAIIAEKGFFQSLNYQSNPKIMIPAYNSKDISI